MADPHFVFKLDHISEQVRRLIGTEARDEKKQTLNRLPFIGEEVFPLVKLLIDEGEKGQRYAFEQALAQSVLKFFRQCLLDPHTSFPAQKSRPTQLNLNWLTANLRDPLALRTQLRATEQAPYGRANINVPDRTLDRLRLVHARAQGHHPGVSR